MTRHAIAFCLLGLAACAASQGLSPDPSSSSSATTTAPPAADATQAPPLDAGTTTTTTTGNNAPTVSAPPASTLSGCASCAGGCSVLAQVQNAYALQTDGTALLAQTPTGIVRVDTSGNVQTLIANDSISSPFVVGPTAYAFYENQTSVYTGASSGATAPQHRVEMAPETLFALDSANLYYMNAAYDVLRLPLDGSEPASTLFKNVGFAQLLGADDAAVYYYDGNNTYRRNKAGGAPIALGDTASQAFGSDATNIYQYANIYLSAMQGLEVVPKDGAAPRRLLNYDPTIMASFPYSGVANDTTDVYAYDPYESHAGYPLRAAPIDGSPSRVLCTAIGDPQGLAAVGGFVYAADASTNTILKIATR